MEYSLYFICISPFTIQWNKKEKQQQKIAHHSSLNLISWILYIHNSIKICKRNEKSNLEHHFYVVCWKNKWKNTRTPFTVILKIVEWDYGNLVIYVCSSTIAVV